METILIVDDEKDLRNMLSFGLSTKGYKVLEASDGQDGLEQIYRNVPDIVVTDVSMPVMDGFTLCQKIRTDIIISHLPVIMLTVHRDDLSQLKGLNIGVDDYVVKPYNFDILCAKIENVLRRNKQNLDANPLTKLPGNVSITREINYLMHNKSPFAFLYIDLNNFKPFNDYYGYAKGDEVIKMLANAAVKVVKNFADEHPPKFVGHVGGDDFVILVVLGIAEKIAQEIIEQFDEKITEFYEPEDIARGFITTTSRKGDTAKFPIMGVSIAITTTENRRYNHFGELNAVVAEIKKKAKESKRSSYFIDKRKTVE